MHLIINLSSTATAIQLYADTLPTRNPLSTHLASEADGLKRWGQKVRRYEKATEGRGSGSNVRQRAVR